MSDGPMTRYGNALGKRPIRSRTGCLTCRRRKKKCDENRPFCTGCYRNNLECEWESNESISTPRRRNRRSRGYDHSLPVEVQRMMKVFFVLTPDLVTRLLGHFFDDSPKWLSTRTGPRRTEYMNWLSPAISESPLVLNCILTIASADLLKYHRGNREMRCAVAEYYGIAVSGLRKAIEDEMNVATPSDTSLPDYTPLAVLLLCVHETQNFTQSERILPHLNAAVFLLQNRTFRKGPDTGLRGFLFESFCYFFALASFSLGSKMPLRGASHIFNAPSVIEYLQEGHIMGTSQHIFTAIYEISSLTPQITSRNPDEVSIARTQLMSLDEDLSGSYAKPDLVEDLNPGDLNDAITSELYRLACRIHIKTLLTPSAPDEDPTMLKLVETFADQLHLLPLDSPSNSILSWPLVVAGLSAKISAHQRIIVAKLTQIYDEWQSDIFSKGAAFLQAKWKSDKYPKKRVQLLELEDSSGPDFRQVEVESFYEADPIWNKCPVILA